MARRISVNFVRRLLVSIRLGKEFFDLGTIHLIVRLIAKETDLFGKAALPLFGVEFFNFVAEIFLRYIYSLTRNIRHFA